MPDTLRPQQLAFLTDFLGIGDSAASDDTRLATLSSAFKALDRQAQAVMKSKPASAAQLKGLIGGTEAALKAEDADEVARQLDMLEDYVARWEERDTTMTFEELVSPDLLQRTVAVGDAESHAAANDYADAVGGIVDLRPEMKKRAQAFEQAFATIRAASEKVLKRLSSSDLDPKEQARLVGELASQRAALRGMIQDLQKVIAQEYAA